MPETQPKNCTAIITQIPQLRPKLSQANAFSATIIQSLTRIPKFLTDSKSVTTRINQIHGPRQSVRETQPKNCAAIITQIPQLRPKLSQANAFSATIIQSLTRIPKFLTDSKSVTTRINQIHGPRQSVRETQPKNCAAIITQIPQLRPKLSQANAFSATIIQSLTRIPKFLTDSKSVTTRINQIHSPRQSVRETQPKNCTAIITQIPQLRPNLSQANAFSAAIIQSLTRIPKFLTDSKSVTTRINQIPRPPPKVSRSPISPLRSPRQVAGKKSKKTEQKNPK